MAGTYGSVVIGSNGAYAFTLNNGSAAVRHSRAGQTVTDSFTYTVSRRRRCDTLHDAYDDSHRHQRRAGGGRQHGCRPENVTTSATGNVLTNDTDVDAGDTKTVSAVNGVAGNVGASVAGTYGSVVIGSNGAYTYTLNNGSAASGPGAPARPPPTPSPTRCGMAPERQAPPP